MIFYKIIDHSSCRREEHETAYKMLSYGLKKLYDITEYNIEKGEHGKPFIAEYPEIKFNISHCKGLVVCGFSDNDIGVDAELIRDFSPRVMERIFSAEEKEFVMSSEDKNRDFFRIWTLKEAYGKYLGTGLFSALNGSSFYFNNGQPFCKNENGVVFTQFILQKKWVVSVCAHDRENDLVSIKSSFVF